MSLNGNTPNEWRRQAQLSDEVSRSRRRRERVPSIWPRPGDWLLVIALAIVAYLFVWGVGIALANDHGCGLTVTEVQTLTNRRCATYKLGHERRLLAQDERAYYRLAQHKPSGSMGIVIALQVIDTDVGWVQLLESCPALNPHGGIGAAYRAKLPAV